MERYCVRHSGAAEKYVSMQDMFKVRDISLLCRLGMRLLKVLRSLRNLRYDTKKVPSVDDPC